MFYIDLPLVILAKMKYQSCGHSAVLKGDVQTLGRQELDSNVLISALLHRHVLHVPKLVLTLRWGRAGKSVCNGRCCRPGIAEISGYSRVGRGLPLREMKNTKFHRLPLPTWRSNPDLLAGLASP